jgi:hypothetical protein
LPRDPVYHAFLREESANAVSAHGRDKLNMHSRAGHGTPNARARRPQYSKAGQQADHQQRLAQRQ